MPSEMLTANEIEARADADNIARAFSLFYELHGAELALKLVSELIRIREKLDAINKVGP